MPAPTALAIGARSSPVPSHAPTYRHLSRAAPLPSMPRPDASPSPSCRRHGGLAGALPLGRPLLPHPGGGAPHCACRGGAGGFVATGALEGWWGPALCPWRCGWSGALRQGQRQEGMKGGRGVQSSKESRGHERLPAGAVPRLAGGPSGGACVGSSPGLVGTHAPCIRAARLARCPRGSGIYLLFKGSILFSA